jgi:protein-tyrosine phosphatase
MWVWTLNWGEIRDDIVVGSCPSAPADIDRICEETGATALLSLQTDECRAALGIDHRAHLDHAARRGVLLVNAPMRDFDPLDQRDRLPDAVGALHRLLDEGHRTYVHCTAGINRGPLTVLGYLTFVEGMTVEDAMALILRGRPEASPYWEPYWACRPGDGP